MEEELGGEGFELGGIFAGDDVGPGVDAGFEGVERGGGFAFGRGGAGGFLGVEAIGVELCLGRHGLKPRGDSAVGCPDLSQQVARVGRFLELLGVDVIEGMMGGGCEGV